MKNGIVAEFSLWFINNYRLSLIMLLATIILGASAYVSHLPREGFPPIQFPGAVVTATYFVNDSSLVDLEVGKPIAAIIAREAEVSSFRSTTSGNIVSGFVSFKEGVDASAASQSLLSKLESASIPAQAQVSITPLAIDKFANKYDMLIAVSANREFTVLQELAHQLAEYLTANSNAIETAQAIDVLTNQVNPLTGQSFTLQTTYSRAAVGNDMLDFNNAVQIGIVAAASSNNTLQLSQDVVSIINKAMLLPEFADLTITYPGDNAISLNQQFSSLEGSAVTALGIVVFMLLLFVNWRASIIAAIFIPTVMTATFLGLLALGQSLNTISLFALILVLGLFVDDAIVVVEAIDYQRKAGKKGLAAIASAINSVGVADILGTLTTLLVFAPLLFVGGILGEFTRAIPTTVITALTVSLIMGLSLIPFLSAIILLPRNYGKGDRLSRMLGFTGQVVDWLANKTAAFIGFYIQPKFKLARGIVLRPGVLIVATATLLLVGVTGSLASQLEFSVFAPPKDSNLLLIEAEFSNGPVELDQALEAVNKVENIVAEQVGQNVVEATTTSGNLSGFRYQLRLEDMSARNITA